MSDNNTKEGTTSKAVGGSAATPPTPAGTASSVTSSPNSCGSAPVAVKTISHTTPTQVAAMSPIGSQSTNQAIATDPATQFRSTLALGQLITAKTPSAGSRIIACELRQLSSTLKQEGAALRKEISTLHTRLADSLKVVLEEDREQRNASGAAGAMGRRPVQFGSFPYRRFPVYRIPRRVSLAFARKSLAGSTAGTSSPPRGNAGTGVSNPTAAAAAVAAAMKSAAAAIVADASSLSPASSPENNGRPQDMSMASKEVATKSTPSTPTGGRQNQSTQTRAMKSPHGTPNRSGTVFKNPWFSRDRSSSSYDGEADTDSDED